MTELPFNEKQLAAAKFRLLLAVALDKTLSKLAVRAAAVIACKRINFEYGAVAFCANATYCLDLGIKSDSAIRAALSELEAGEYFTAEKEPGKPTRYMIADRFFAKDDPRRETRRGDEQTPPENEADTPPQDEAGTPPHFTADTPPRHEATNTGKGIPENESRKMNPGKGGREKATSDDIFSSEDASKKKQPRVKKSEIDELFERRFWPRWPHKVGKPYALKAFEKCWREIDAIVAGVDRYIAAKPPDRQWLNPATFLNQRRWEDEPAQAVVSANGGPSPGRRRSPDDIWAIAGLCDPYKSGGH